MSESIQNPETPQADTASESASTEATRRTFIKGTTAAGITAALASTGIGSAAYAQGDDTVKVGLVGCGGRGSGAAGNAIEASSGVVLSAMGDLYEDRLNGSANGLQQNSGEAYQVGTNKFVGWDAYQQVINSDVDLCIFATPPQFRPMMVKAAVDAGKHVFFEKPVAVDPTGCRTIMEAGDIATEKGLGMVCGTQRRHQKGYVDAMAAIHDGAIGEVIGAQVFWQQGGLWNRGRNDDWTNLDWQLRNWLYFTWLSGDHIVEQHVHNIDVALWAFGDEAPKKAYGNGGRQQRTSEDYGHGLVVGVHSDEEILRNKGPPVMNNEERLATVRACKWVDEVVFDTPYTPSCATLDRVNAHFAVHGDDTPMGADGRGAYDELADTGRLRIIKRTEGISTTDLVGRLLLMTKKHHISVPTLAAVPPATTSARARQGHFGSFSSDLSAPVDVATSPALRPQSPNDSSADSDHPPLDQNLSSFLTTTRRILSFSNGKAPKPDDKVVYIDGAFDLFHIGHIETLKHAKELGTFLYVGLHDDATINRHKGNNYPIMNLYERVLNVLSCKYVDEVIIGAPWVVTKDMLTTLGVHLVVSGSNTKMDPLRECRTDPYATPRDMGIYREVQTTVDLTTDGVVARIIDNRKKYTKRNQTREVKEQEYYKTKRHVAEL